MRKAFTLIELLIVLIIIGVLVALAVPQYEKFVIRARGAEAMTNLRAFADSSWRYYLETGIFPPHEGDPPPLPGQIGTNYPIPSTIDVKMDSSKYFLYWYYNYFSPYGIPTGGSPVTIGAYDDNAFKNGPPGSIVTYMISYAYNTTSPYMTVQRMDEHWTKYYVHGLKKADGTIEYKYGWPGGDN